MDVAVRKAELARVPQSKCKEHTERCVKIWNESKQVVGSKELDYEKRIVVTTRQRRRAAHAPSIKPLRGILVCFSVTKS